MKKHIILVLSALAVFGLSAPVDAECYDPPGAYVVWSKCQFARKNFEGVDLSGAVMDDIVLHHSKLKGINLEQADLRGADLSNTEVSGANLKRARLNKAIIKDANLTGADLSGANLEGADLDLDHFRGADFITKSSTHEKRQW